MQSNPKSQKLSEGHDVGQKIDRISDLPDNILLHILSFTSTKEAIRTSLLSKRWKDLWIFLPDVDLQRSCLELESSFTVLVSKALFHRDTSHLRKFCLELNFDVSLDLFKDWISAAIEHNVQVLDLNLCGGQSFVLPPSFFTSKSLCNLKLSMLHTLEIPSQICFISLKCLTLSRVTFRDDESTQLLFSGFPILEELVLHDCDWQKINCVTISIPTLRKFAFLLETLKHGLLECKIKLYAVNLKSFKYAGFLTVKVLLCNVPLLVNSYVCFYKTVDADYLETIRRAAQLLGRIYRVKFLTITSETLRFLFPKNLAVHLPKFYNLIHLEVGLNHRGVLVSAGRELMCFLNKSPNLQSLDIPVGINTSIFDTLPDCLKSRLKRFSLSKFAAVEYEINFVKFLVTNATALEKVTILAVWADTAFHFGKQEGIEQQLEKLCLSSHVLKLSKTLDLLLHAAQCQLQHCQYQYCDKARGLFQHGRQCKVYSSGGCNLCKKLWYVLQLHARACKESECQLPRCRSLKEYFTKQGGNYNRIPFEMIGVT